MGDLYYLLAYFLLYSVLGWVLEVAYHVVSQGKVINRGFLNGPVCPIYGVGMVVVIVILEPYSSHLLLLFIGGIIFATFIELVGGFFLYKLFHMRWWDYSKEPFNLGGFICLKFSLAWGVCIVFAVDIIHPIVELNVYIMDGFLGHIAVIAFCVLYGFDSIITVLSIMNLNKDLKRMNAIATDLRKISDGLTVRIGEKTFQADAKVQEGRLQAALAKAELKDRMKEEEKKISSHRIAHIILGYGRLYRAFPEMKHVLYDNELHKVIDNLEKKVMTH